MNYLIFILSFTSLIISCKKKSSRQTAAVAIIEPKVKAIVQDSVFNYKKEFIATSFDFPVGKPNAKGYYNAQKFKENNHLGEDWNAVTGGNSDLGAPIYATANGYVKFAEDIKGGWGNVIRILHKLPNQKKIESLYAHCDTILVKEKQWVTKGTKIGTIGNAHGIYLAHLHFEIREDISLPIGGGYSENSEGYLNPTKFITEN